MKPDSYWKVIFKTPSTARTATIAILVMWGLAAVWGWFFVESTVLRDSQAARDYVELMSKVFPWIDNIRRLVPAAEKGLYLHSVYTVVLAPVSVICTLIIARRPEGRERETAATLRDRLIASLFCFALIGFGIFVMYNGILQPSLGKLHRTGYSFVMSQLTTPVVAPFFIMSFWSVFAGGIYFAYLLIQKLISKESRNG